MKQTLFWAAIALAAWMNCFESRATAQQSASTPAEESADASQPEQASTDTVNGASSQPADSQPTQPADAKPAERPSTATTGQSQDTTRDTANEQRDSANQQSQPSDSQTPALPAPANHPLQQPAATQDRSSTQAPVDQRQQFDRGRTDRSTDRFDDRDRDRFGRDDRLRRDRSRDVDVNLGLHFGVATGRGLTIDAIDQGSVFFDSGLRRGDVLISIDGRPIRSEVEFVEFVRLNPSRRVPVIVLRDGREETVYITYNQDVVATRPYDDRQAPMAGGQPYLGVSFDGRIHDAAIVQSVTPDSPAARAGLQPQDVILAINNQEVRTYGDAIAIIRAMRPGEQVNIDFSRPADHRTQTVLGSRPGEPLRTARYPEDIRVERQYVPGPPPIDRGPPIYRDRGVELRFDDDRDWERDRDFDRDDDDDFDDDDDDGGGVRSLLPFRRN